MTQVTESVAFELADSPLAQNVRIAAGRTELNPTPEQKESDQYRKGRVQIQGLIISIENPQLSHRSGVGPDGKPWRSLLTLDYGFIESIDSVDGDKLDVFLGPRPESELVVVIDQVDQTTGEFNESKVLIGWDNKKEAVLAYLQQYQQGWRVGQVSSLTMDQFKDWAARGGAMQPASIAVDAMKEMMASGSGITVESAMRHMRLLASEYP